MPPSLVLRGRRGLKISGVLSASCSNKVRRLLPTWCPFSGAKTGLFLGDNLEKELVLRRRYFVFLSSQPADLIKQFKLNVVRPQCCSFSILESKKSRNCILRTPRSDEEI